jgi:hypothetical protein
MPPRGEINFSDFSNAPSLTNLLVLEPCPGTPPEHITTAINLLNSTWSNS